LMLYAFTLEFADLHTTQDYSYSVLQPMIGSGAEGIPIEVPISWAVIVHCCMRTSDRLNLPWNIRPFYDGVLAVALDLVLDPVLSASRAVPALGGGCLSGDNAVTGGLGMWIWCIPKGAEGFWLTVPMVNFVGWVLVVAAVSYAVRRAAQQAANQPLGRTLFVVARNLVLALLAVVGTMFAFRNYVKPADAQAGVLAALMLIGLGVALLKGSPWRLQNAIDWPVFGFFLSMLIPYGALFYVRGMAGNDPSANGLFAGALALVTVLVVMPYARGTAASSSVKTGSASA
jgi:hypothetical protein